MQGRFSAAVLQTKPGERVGPLRITLGRERVYSVRGRIVTEVPKSHDWGASAWAVANRPTLEIGALYASPAYYEGHVDQSTGEFNIRGLPVGEYTILVQAGKPLLCDTCPMPPRFRFTTRIRVDHDVTGIVATILPNTSVTGHLILDSKELRPPVKEQRVSLEQGMTSYLGGGPIGTVNGDGFFRINEVPPGDYTVHVLKESQYFIQVRQNGRLTPGNLARIESGSSPDLEITLRRATAAIQVKVDGNVRSWPSYPLSALAVPEDGWEDPYSWTGPAWVQEDGSVTLPVGQPGRYFVLATQNLSGYTIEAWGDELRRHARAATPVLAKDGYTEVVTVPPLAIDSTDVGPNKQPPK
jgi:hypothetical protein